jgi:hypothetical protein
VLTGPETELLDQLLAQLQDDGEDQGSSPADVPAASSPSATPAARRRLDFPTPPEQRVGLPAQVALPAPPTLAIPPPASSQVCSSTPRRGLGLAETLAKHLQPRDRAGAVRSEGARTGSSPPETLARKHLQPRDRAGAVRSEGARTGSSLPRSSRDFEQWVQSRIESLATVPTRKTEVREKAAAQRATLGQPNPERPKKRAKKKRAPQAAEASSPSLAQAQQRPKRERPQERDLPERGRQADRAAEPPQRPPNAARPRSKAKTAAGPRPPKRGPKPDASAPGQTRKCLYSKAYHSALSEARREGIALDDAKQLAQAAGQAAVAHL